MTPDQTNLEDRLRSILQEEAATIEPTDGRWDEVSRALVRVPRGQRMQRIAVATVAAVAVLVVGLVATSQLNDDDTEVQTTSPTTTDTVADVVTPPAGSEAPGIWPFRTADEADSYSATEFRDPRHTAESFLRTYVGMTRVTLGEFREGDVRSGEVEAETRAGGPITTVLLRRLGASDAWTVIGASTPNIVLDQPTTFDAISSPVSIRGTSTAFEGNVVIEVRDDPQTAGEFLAREPLIGGANGEMGPLRGEVAFTAPTSRAGAVVAYTGSAMDGAIEEATVVRISFATTEVPPLPSGAPLSNDEAVVVRTTSNAEGIPQDAVEVLSLADGQALRTLATADGSEGGVGDVALTPDRRTVLYSVGTSACEDRVVAVAADGTGAPADLGSGRELAIDSTGARLAMTRDSDCDGQSELVVRNVATGVEQTWPDLSEGAAGLEQRPVRVNHLSWAPDGRWLVYQVQFEDGIDVQVHDMTDASLQAGNAQRVEPRDDSTSWGLPTFVGTTGRIGVLERCCGPTGKQVAVRQIQPDGSAPPDDRPTDIGGGTVIDLTWSPEGDRFLWVTADHEVWLSGAAARLIASGVRAITW